MLEEMVDEELSVLDPGVDMAMGEYDVDGDEEGEEAEDAEEEGPPKRGRVKAKAKAKAKARTKQVKKKPAAAAPASLMMMPQQPQQPQPESSQQPQQPHPDSSQQPQPESPQQPQIPQPQAALVDQPRKRKRKGCLIDGDEKKNDDGPERRDRAKARKFNDIWDSLDVETQEHYKSLPTRAAKTQFINANIERPKNRHLVAKPGMLVTHQAKREDECNSGQKLHGLIRAEALARVGGDPLALDEAVKGGLVNTSNVKGIQVCLGTKVL